MPNYTYKCTKCNKEININQKMFDEDFKTCNQIINCKNSGSLIKLISIPSLKFNGSGFYVNDYKNNNKK